MSYFTIPDEYLPPPPMFSPRPQWVDDLIHRPTQDHKWVVPCAPQTVSTSSLEQRIAELERKVEELTARLGEPK